MSGVTPQQVQEAIGVLLSVFADPGSERITKVHVEVGEYLRATTYDGGELVAKIVCTG